MLRTGRVASIDGTEIAFSEWGNPRGAPVVLIHGWLFSRQAFARQVHSELAERCRLVAYDLRGHGESGKPAAPEAYSDGALWVADLNCTLQAMGMEHPTLAGWSLGGRVAAHSVFLAGLERVAGLNLISARLLQTASASPAAAADPAAATARFIRNCTREPLDQQHEQLFSNTAMAVPPVAREGASTWHRDYGNFFDALNLPVLVTHGDSDALTPSVAAENIARRLRGRLSIYPNCGHMPFWEAPERFNRELADFAERMS